MKRTAEHIFLMAFLLLILTLSSFAQNFNTRVYTSADGLPDSYISSVYQDSKGYLWVGTMSSLCRFDGKSFTRFNPFRDSTDFKGIILLEDSSHRLWFGSKGQVYAYKAGRTRNYPLSDHKKTGWIFGIQQMDQQKLWLFTDIGLYELRDTLWQKLDLVPTREHSCRQAVETDDGLYLNSGKQIFFRNRQGVWSAITPFRKQYPYYIWMREYDNKPYINTAEGLFRIDHDKLVPIFEKQLRKHDSYAFIRDSKKRFWIATEEHGLLVSEPGNESELTYTVPLQNNQTVALSEDREGNIWGLNFEGLLKVQDLFFKVYKGPAHPLVRDIRHLFTSPSGALLAFGGGTGFLTNKEEGFALAEGYARFRKQMANEVVDAAEYDADGALWVVTRRGGAYRFDRQGVEDLRKKYPDEFFLHLSFDKVHRIMYLSGNNLYTVQGDSLQLFRGSNGMVISEPQFIFESNGRMIVDTRDTNLFIIDEGQRVRSWEGGFPRGQTAGHFQLINDPSGGFWTSFFNDGLRKFRWDENGRPVPELQITTRDGLPNSYVVSAAFDGQNRLWAATLSGLVVIQKENSSYTVSRVDDEGVIGIGNWGQAKITRDGKGTIWLSSFHEIIRFDAGPLKFDTGIPRAQIEKVALDLQETDWSKWTDSLDPLNSVPYFVRLPHNRNTVSISFNGVTFSHSGNVIYAYKLEGLDDSWKEAQNNGTVSFNLPPGRYDFVVKARKPNTPWSPEARFSFVILEPFWSTWWFQLLFACIMAGLIAYFVRGRIQRIRKKAAVQEQLHNLEMKALKAQMNPHFIYNALNSIQSLVIDNRRDEALKYIGKFARLLRQVLEHSDNHLITLEKELSTLNLYIQLEALRLNATLDVQISVDDQVMPEKELLPPLIIQPYVENALWHGLSKKQGERKLWISIDATDHWLYIRIRDNGIGRQQAAAHKKESSVYTPSKGMSITAQRLVKLNQDSVADTVTVADLFDEEQQPRGTEVTLRVRRETKA